MTAVRLGTRGSRLAMVQANAMADALRAAAPDATVEIVEIRTSGDRIQDVALGPDLGQAFFTKEIEDALLAGRIDLAVHSCKDLPTKLPDGLRLGAVPRREDPRDVLVSARGPLAELPDGAAVGTASVRRQAFLGHARPDLSLRMLRGNVPTRVRAVDEGRMDAVVLAAAGLRRLGMGERITEYVDPDVLPPAAAQGAIAIEIRDDDPATAELVARLDHPGTRAAVAAERACLHRLEAGCQAPVGVLATVGGDRLVVRAAVAGPAGPVRAQAEGPPTGAAAGTAVADELLARLGLASLRDAEWAGPPPRSAE